MQNAFKAMIVEETEPNKFVRKFGERTVESLPAGDVLIRVHYSSLNYKDALSARGHKGITRRYPHTPGIDAAGVVEWSDSALFKTGERVIVTGYDLGMNTSGGFSEYIRVPAAWVVPLPDVISFREAMIYGTAGFTAGICIHELQKHGIMPETGKILVTGATGGVGCLAAAMLAKIGYTVSASTGKQESYKFLENIGVNEILTRENVSDKSGKPLLSARWAGAIDSVGGNTLSTVIRSIQPRGSVCVLGLVESDKFESTVYPFLLRGINILGIDSAERSMDYRLNIWNKIFGEWRLDNLNFIAKEVALTDLEPEIEKILKGGQVGRVVVRV